MYDDFLGPETRRHLRADPFHMEPPRAARYIFGIDDVLLGAGILGGTSLLGNLFGASAGKGRANAMQGLFNQQRDFMRGRFYGVPAQNGPGGIPSAFNLGGGSSNMGPDQVPYQPGSEDIYRRYLRQAMGVTQGNINADRSVADAFRKKTDQGLNAAGAQYRNVINTVNQTGQSARAEIQDQGRAAGAATQRALQGRGLGSSTVLAGAGAQNQYATQRATSDLATGVAGVRANAQSQLADFLKFRAEYQPQSLLQARDFVRRSQMDKAGLLERTGAGTAGLMDSHTQFDTQFLAEMMNAAVGGKGAMGAGIGNSIGQIGNMLGFLALSGGFGGSGGGGGYSSGYGTRWGVSGG